MKLCLFKSNVVHTKKEHRGVYVQCGRVTPAASFNLSDTVFLDDIIHILIASAGEVNKH